MTEVPPRLDEIAASVLRRECVVAAWVFGSVARGDANATSDLDLAVLLRYPPQARDEAEMRVLATDLGPYSPSGRVDIVVLGAQGAVFRHRVLREGHLIVDRSPAQRHAFESRTITEFLDWKPTHDIAMAATMSGLRRRFATG